MSIGSLQQQKGLYEGGKPYHGGTASSARGRLEVQIFYDPFSGDDMVRARAGIQTDGDAYTSESRFATSPTLSFTTGVMGAKDDDLVMVPDAAGLWPFIWLVICVRRVWPFVWLIVCVRRVWLGGWIRGASLRFPPRSYPSLIE